MNKPMRSHRKTTDVDKLKEETAWAKRVKERDGYRCQFEHWDGNQWVTCGQRSAPHNPLFAAHIYGRDNCGKVKFVDEVGITACVNDHDRYDRRIHDNVIVRIPPEREAVAYAIASAAVEFTIKRRMPPEDPSGLARF
jgi:hypothetical protein